MECPFKANTPLNDNSCTEEKCAVWLRISDDEDTGGCSFTRIAFELAIKRIVTHIL